MATALAVLFACTLGGAGPASAAKKKQQRACAQAAAIPQASTMQQSLNAVLCLVNKERTSRGLPAVRISAPLSRAALDHSSDMVTRQYFGHENLDGLLPRDRVTRTGYFAGSTSGKVEESLACGWQQLSTPQALVASLMRSPGHKGILLARSMRDVGIGIALGGPMAGPSGGVTLTLDLGRR